MINIEIDLDKCEGCGDCVEICPGEVLELNEEEKAEVVDLDACTECCSCVETCPNEAITHSSC